MSNHQRTMDYLNESFQQETHLDLSNLDYLEKIKRINVDWLKVKSLISARFDVSLIPMINPLLSVFVYSDVGTSQLAIHATRSESSHPFRLGRRTNVRSGIHASKNLRRSEHQEMRSQSSLSAPPSSHLRCP